MCVCVCVCWGLRVGKGMIFTVFMFVVRLSVRASPFAFWFLLLFLPNNLRTLNIFCIDVDIDDMLLLDRKGLMD